MRDTLVQLRLRDRFGVCNSHGMDLRLLSSAEAADRLNIDRATLSRWTHAGKLKPAHRNPGPTGAVLYFATDVQALGNIILREAELALTTCTKCGQQLPKASA